jgi:hypothetical protein
MTRKICLSFIHGLGDEMVQFQAFTKNIQVNGTTIMSVVHGLGSLSKLAEDFFLQVGLPHPDEIVAKPNLWYCQQKWLEAFRLISEKLGENILFMIGTKIPENAIFPSNINNIEDGLRSIDIAYHMNHRDESGRVLFNSKRNPAMLEGIGHYEFKKSTDEEKIFLVCENPYPCDFDRGIITAVARKYEPAALIQHDDNQSCRKHGGDSCTYIVHVYSDLEAERQRLVELRNNYFDALNHGLRTPMAQVLFGLEYFSKTYYPKLPPHEKKVFDSIMRSVDRLQHFVEYAFADPINMILNL